MLKPTTNMKNALAKMGLESGKAGIEAYGLQGFLEKLKESVGGDELAFTKLFKRVEAMTAALTLTGSQAENFTSKTKEMTRATGAATDAFEIQNDTTQATFDRLKQSFVVFKTTLGEALLPMVEKMAAGLENLSDKMANLDQTQIDSIAKTLKTVAALGGVAAALLIVGKVLKSVNGVLAIFNSSLLALAANPVTWIVLGIVAAMAGLLLITKKVAEREAEASRQRQANYQADLDARLETINEEYAANTAHADAIIAQNQKVADRNIAWIEKTRDKDIAALDARLEQTVSFYQKTKERAQETYDANISKIREEYGYVESTTKSKTDVVNDYYDAMIEGANKAYDESIKLANKQLASDLAAVDAETAAEVQKIQDQIEGINSLTTAEEEELRKQEEQNRYTQLQKAIDAAESVEDRKTAEKELQDFVDEIERTQLLKSRENAIQALRDKITDIKDHGDDLKEELKTQNETELENLQTHLDNQIVKYGEKRDKEIKIIQDEREKKEKEELNKFASTVRYADKQISYLENVWLPSMKAKYIEDANNAIAEANRKNTELSAAAEKVKETLSFVADMEWSDAQVAAYQTYKDNEAIAAGTYDPNQTAADNFVGSTSFDMMTDAIGNRAFGGEVQAGHSYLVGERGTEIFTPGRDGNIKAGAQNPVTINVNGADDPDAVAAAVVRILKMQGVY